MQDFWSSLGPLSSALQSACHAAGGSGELHWPAGSLHTSANEQLSVHGANPLMGYINGKGSEHKDPPERFPPDGLPSHTFPYVMLTVNINEDLLNYIKEDIEFKRPEAMWQALHPRGDGAKHSLDKKTGFEMAAGVEDHRHCFSHLCPNEPIHELGVNSFDAQKSPQSAKGQMTAWDVR